MSEWGAEIGGAAVEEAAGGEEAGGGGRACQLSQSHASQTVNAFFQQLIP